MKNKLILINFLVLAVLLVFWCHELINSISYNSILFNRESRIDDRLSPVFGCVVLLFLMLGITAVVLTKKGTWLAPIMLGFLSLLTLYSLRSSIYFYFPNQYYEAFVMPEFIAIYLSSFALLTSFLSGMALLTIKLKR